MHLVSLAEQRCADLYRMLSIKRRAGPAYRDPFSVCAMTKILPLCVLLVAHASAASAFKLGLGEGSITVDGSLPAVSSGALTGGSSGASSDGYGVSGLLDIVSSAGLLGIGSSPLDPVFSSLDGTTNVLSPIIDELAGNLLFDLAPLLDLSDAGLVDALANPLGLANLTNTVTAALLGVVGKLTSVVVPDELQYGPAPDEEARRFGLKAERIRIVTPDGYVLTVFRIRSACTLPGRVVIITTSTAMSSASFILLQGESLAYKLAWQCNDVWIVPFRCSRWGAENTKLSRDSPEFWNSTILELGIYDLRVSIEYISECTGSTSIRIITADIGGAALVAMNSKLGADSPQCKLGHVYIIEPFVCMQHTESIIFAGQKLIRDGDRIGGNLVTHNQIILGDKPLHTVLYLLCGVLSPEACIPFSKIFFGISDSMDPKSFPYAFRYIFDNVQVPVAVNILQTMRSDRCLCEFDYGKPRNLAVYNSEKPPAYDITATTVHVSLYFNEKSSLVPEEDWQTTYNSFHPSARRRFFVIKDGNFLTHYVPKNPDTFFYNKLLADMEEDYRNDCISACTKPCRSCK